MNFVPADISSLFELRIAEPDEVRIHRRLRAGVQSRVREAEQPGVRPGQLVTPNAEQTYLLADAAHLTTAGQTIEADYIYSLLTAPSQISLLAESAVQVGLARMATIQRQIDLSGQHRGPNGVNVWTSAGASNLSMNNAPNFPTASGTPFGGTVGADYLLPGGVIVGAALTAGGQTQRFSTGGHFNQSGEALSLYAAYSAGPIWGNAIASYGLLQNHIARQVTLGMFTDQNSADTDGHSLALALRGGYDFKIGRVHHRPRGGRGPAAGAHQRLHRDRYQRRLRPLVRQPDTWLGGQPTRLAGRGGPGRLAALRRAGVEPRVGQQEPHDRRRRSRRSRHRPGPPPECRSPPTGPPPRSAPPTNSARR